MAIERIRPRCTALGEIDRGAIGEFVGTSEQAAKNLLGAERGT